MRKISRDIIINAKVTLYVSMSRFHAETTEQIKIKFGTVIFYIQKKGYRLLLNGKKGCKEFKKGMKVCINATLSYYSVRT